MYDMRRPISALAAGLLGVSATVGCSVLPTAAAGHPDPPGTAAVTRKPIPPAALKSLPAGVFYLLAGGHPNDTNVWEVSSAGVEEQLTRNPPGFEIDGMAASASGLIVADSLQGIDQLARLTSQGPDWLLTTHRPGQQIAGQAPDIRPDGGITYLLPRAPRTTPSGSGGPSPAPRRSSTGTRLPPGRRSSVRAVR
jgi:hypothetical protein